MKDAVDLLNEKITRLRQRVAELESQVDEMSGTFTSKESVIRDAKRYHICRSRGCEFPDTHTLYEEEVDMYCDAAMADPDDDFTRGEHDL